MTHATLTQLAADWLRTQHGMVVLTEARARQFGLRGEQPDVYGAFNGAATAVIECKVSASNFAADDKKPHRHGRGIGTLRWFCCPDHLIESYQVGEGVYWGWGLLYVDEQGGVREVIEPSVQPIARRDTVAELAIMVQVVRHYEQTTGRKADDVKQANSIPVTLMPLITEEVRKAIDGVCEAKYVVQQIPALEAHFKGRQKARNAVIRAAKAGQIPGIETSEWHSVTYLEAAGE